MTDFLGLPYLKLNLHFNFHFRWSIYGTYFYIAMTVFSFNHFADAFIQSDVQRRRIIEEIRPLREQQYTSVMTSLS